MTTELTPAVQDAAYRLGWAMARAGMSDIMDFYGCGEIDEMAMLIDQAVTNGWADFTPEAEAERMEAVREAGKRLMKNRERDSLFRLRC